MTERICIYEFNVSRKHYNKERIIKTCFYDDGTYETYDMQRGRVVHYWIIEDGQLMFKHKPTEKWGKWIAANYHNDTQKETYHIVEAIQNDVLHKAFFGE